MRLKQGANIRVRFLFLFFFMFLFAPALQGQRRFVTISPVRDSMLLDSVPVSSLSVRVFHRGQELQRNADFHLSPDFKYIVFHEAKKWDTLHVEYMRFPDWLLRTRRHREAIILSGGDREGGHGGNDAGDKQSETDVNTDGILLRGISFGNAQDLVLNSSLNLRMNGRITKDISIEGAVTDQEFPFQPEGTTTTLQDFDRIYVQLKMPHISVLLGDHAFQSPSQLLFMKYAKKDRGLQLLGTDSVSGGILHWEAAAALARGRFNRNEINGIEGLQGPYRLKGARDEQFIIIVSGTEVVYLDGKRMERGLQADYIIDYNNGEITFTPKNIINAYSRIVVEFQYSDRAYTRSVTGGNITMQTTKWDLFAAVYSEQDARNQPIQQDLDAYDSTSGKTAREILQGAGDNLSAAVLASVHVNAEFSTSVPNYVRRDTGAVTFYEYVDMADTHQLFYTVNFTYLGPGKGHYVLKGAVANGKAYRYVGEINGMPAGDYEPVTLLRSPNRISMLEGGFRFKPGKSTSIKVNTAYSSNDKNLFSGINDNDNNGFAGHINVTDLHKFGKNDTLPRWYVSSKLDVEHTSANFTSIERYREVEFGRDWNKSLYNPENGLDPKGSDYAKAYVEVGKEKLLNVNVKGGVNKAFNSDAMFGGVGLKVMHKGFFVEPRMDFTSATRPSTIKFTRYNVDAGFRNSSTQLVLNGQKEESRFTNNINEILTQSYAYRQSGFLFEKRRESGLLALNYSYRINSDLKDLLLTDAVHVQNASLEWNQRSKKGRYFRISGTWRSMDLRDTFFKNKYASEDHVGGRVEYNFNKIAKIFSGNMYYQTISGREQQRQYSYFEVPAGQGYYAWIDFNGNGVKEVNEFQETAFKDQARYVRLLVPTGTYIKSQGTELAGNLITQPGAGKPAGKMKWLNRLNWNYAGKSTEKDWFKRVAPFVSDRKDSSILALNSFVRDQVECDILNGLYLVQYTFQTRASKTFFTSGFDTRKSESSIIFFRGNIGKSWQVRNGVEHKQSHYTSEYLPQNSFDYTHQSVEPAISWQPTSRFRITLNGKLAADRSGAMKVADQVEGGIQLTKTVGKSGILDIKTSVLDAAYFLPKGTMLAYDVLQGFSAGKNYRGTVDLRFNAAKNIQMVLSYEGRKTADAKMIHIGRAEARYLF